MKNHALPSPPAHRRFGPDCPSVPPNRPAGYAIFRIVWLLPLLLLLTASVQAQDYTYTIESGLVTITGYTGAGGAAIIPDTIDGLPVTAIGAEAFREENELTSVTIPENVTSIGFGVFGGCRSLMSVTIGNGVSDIGDGAFRNCTSLTSVYFMGNAPAPSVLRGSPEPSMS